MSDDPIPLLRAQAEMIEEMRKALEDIKQATQRLYAPTAQELQERLDRIAAIVDHSLIK